MCERIRKGRERREEQREAYRGRGGGARGRKSKNAKEWQAAHGSCRRPTFIQTVHAFPDNAKTQQAHRTVMDQE